MGGIAQGRACRCATTVLAGWLAATALISTASAADLRRTELALIGEPKFKSDFKSFDWINPDAPKGGRIRQYALGSFDSLNQYPAQGEPASGLTLLFDTLFVQSPDEASAEYGLIAEWVSYPPDVSSATYGLRSSARFNDGKPVTPEDVVFSFETLKKASPRYSVYYQHVVKAEKSGPNEVRFTFDVKDNRELPSILSQLPILPKHWWDGKTPAGEPRDISKSSLEIPVGSGPYRIKAFEAGRSITYERVKDWWAAGLAVTRGQYNFDEINVTYFRERTAPFEAFKRGDLDFWIESSAKDWATEYEFDAVKRGLVKKEQIAVKRVAPMQAFFMNTRRPVFQDARVRRAMHLALDFDWYNKNLFFNSYFRLNSYFDNSELAHRGLPEGRELAILNEVKADLPPEVFTMPFNAMAGATADEARRNLAAASKLLAEAGYTNQGGVLKNAAGQPLAFEFLLDNPSYPRIVQPLKNALEKLGVSLTIRVVDSAQYQRRTDDFDYDMIFGQVPQSESPGNEQRDFFGTASVNMKRGRNVAGISNKAIDAIIEKVVFAPDRAELIAATRALDRALLWNFYAIPTWHLPATRVAYWDTFGRPTTLPARSVDFIRSWWFDPDKAKALGTARGK